MNPTVNTWLLSALLALLLAASYHLDRNTPDDISSASATAQLASDSRFVVISQGGKP